MPPPRLRLDWVSPLPPVRSGIADYSADLLPFLAELADVRVLRLPGQAVSAEIAARWRPVPIERLGDGGRLPVYQMGNNHLHAEVERAARRLPGVVTLHDVVLHHLLLDQTLGRGDWTGYLERLTADHGWIGEAVVRGFGWGVYGDAAQFALPAHRSLLGRQRGVVVHSRWAADLVREEIPALAVRVVPMAVPLPPAADAAAGAALRAELGIPEQAPLLGSFGFQTPIKRTDTVIRALAAGGLEGCHLLIGGEVSAGLDLVAAARSAGVGARVHRLGYVSFARLDAALAACDLCLNLRYPTAGETSASLLRVLAAGRPVVVSDFAQFRDLPAEIVRRAPLGGDGAEESEALAAVVRAALADRAGLERMAKAARAYVAREHDPRAASERLVAAVADLEAEPSRAEATPPGRDDQPPSSWVWQPLSGEITVEPLEAWPAGERRRLRVRLRNTGRARWLPSREAMGGVALAVRMLAEGGEERPSARPWLTVDHDVAPGETVEFTLDLRRPLGAARLLIEPQVLARGRMALFGGPSWEAAI